MTANASQLTSAPKPLQSPPAAPQISSPQQNFSDLQIKATREALEGIREAYEMLNSDFIVIQEHKLICVLSSILNESNIDNIGILFQRNFPNEIISNYTITLTSAIEMEKITVFSVKQKLGVEIADLKTLQDRVAKLYSDSRESYAFYMMIMNGLSHLFLPTQEALKTSLANLKIEEIKEKLAAFENIPQNGFTKDKLMKATRVVMTFALHYANAYGKEAARIAPKFMSEPGLSTWTLDKVKRLAV